MASIDIRSALPEEIYEIILADSDDAGADRIRKGNYYDTNGLYVEDSFEGNSIFVPRMNVQNLIAALQKAIELGWTK